MVKIEGTLEEIYELVEGARKVVRTTRKVAKKTRSAGGKVKRKLSAWQKYIKNKRNHIKFKSGSNKGKLNLKAMSRVFKRKKKR